MMTKIFHPNVSKAGEICVDTLKKGWKKEYGVGHVLVVRPLPLLPLLRLTAPEPSLSNPDLDPEWSDFIARVRSSLWRRQKRNRRMGRRDAEHAWA